MNRLRMAALAGLLGGLGLLSGCGNLGHGQGLTSMGCGRAPCCSCVMGGEPCCDGPLLEEGGPYQGLPGMSMPGMALPGTSMPGMTLPGQGIPPMTMPPMTNGTLPPLDQGIPRLDQGIPRLVPQPTPIMPPAAGPVPPVPQAVPTPAGPVSRTR